MTGVNEMKTQHNIDIVYKFFIEAMLWADFEDRGRVSSNNERIIKQFIREVTKEILNLCPEFESIDKEFYTLNQYGHDLYLTVNHHGVGFWYREQLQKDSLGDQITDICQKFHFEAERARGGWINIYYR